MGLFLQVFTVLVITVSLQGWLPLGCLEEERIALLHLKDSLNYPNGTSLPSWIKDDAQCCDWEHIECSSSTGRVIELVLDSTRNEEVGDWYFNASLFRPFQQLEWLSLSYNRIAGWVEIKESLSSVQYLLLDGNNINKLVASRGPNNLRYLSLKNITTNGSSFQLLSSLGAFPNLTTVYLNDNDFKGTILELQNLSSLKKLYLNGCSLDENSIQILGALSSLKYLSLYEVSGIVSSRGFLNILKNLEHLYSSDSTLDNSILQSIGTITSLKILELVKCRLNGQLPIGLCNLNNLQELDMRDNDISGFLIPCLANLTSLQRLDLSSNHLKIPMSLSPLYNLSKLKSFHGLDNEIYAEEDDHNLSPKFQLQSLYLSNHGQGARAFPRFLYHQLNLQSLDLTNIQMKGDFPNWLIENNTYLKNLYLENCSLSGPFLLPKNSHMNLSILSISMNYLQGQIPSEIGAHLPRLTVLSMSHNGFNGSIPSSLSNMSLLRDLDLSNNVLTGRIPKHLTTSLCLFNFLILSNNSLQGAIPDSMSNCSSLQLLDVSNNNLSPRIPGWIWSMSFLDFLDLSRNNFSGPLPPTISTSSTLRYVYLSRNKLQGLITKAFYNFSTLLTLDLSHNNLIGTIPEWIGSLSKLRYLLLSYNKLEGEIPIQLCKLDGLTLIDLSHNHLSGDILSCMTSLAPFSALTDATIVETSQQYLEFTTKNVSLIYRGSIVKLFSGIDFSCNNFTGKIPPEIENLSKIKALNLSHNSLIGPIPPTFSRLKEIESLDLSHNKLDGEIPPQLTELFSLEIFSVAHNNLSGKTPARVAQFATFEESCYKDNPFLCGEPLPKICGASMLPSPTSMNNEDNGGFIDMEVFYVSFGIAYIMVLLVIVAVLYINPYWRRAWFHFTEVSINNCYYFVVDNLPILSKFRFS
ncbi:receptor like protein 21 isoform X4 [Populus trichocarpa]|uniref:receptor like protein 21 isoform X4 n=1 Tax=Populus trichocarpa TaxID=3694 RepID=UPI002277B402|nr:receptor like protein 21 isoform X4 [Populus trichocarpa]